MRRSRASVVLAAVAWLAGACTEFETDVVTLVVAGGDSPAVGPAGFELVEVCNTSAHPRDPLPITVTASAGAWRLPDAADKPMTTSGELGAAMSCATFEWVPPVAPGVVRMTVATGSATLASTDVKVVRPEEAALELELAPAEGIVADPDDEVVVTLCNRAPRPVPGLELVVTTTDGAWVVPDAASAAQTRTFRPTAATQCGSAAWKPPGSAKDIEMRVKAGSDTLLSRTVTIGDPPDGIDLALTAPASTVAGAAEPVTVCNEASSPEAVTVTLAATGGSWVFPSDPDSPTETRVSLTSESPCTTESWRAPAGAGPVRLEARVGSDVHARSDVDVLSGVALAFDTPPGVAADGVSSAEIRICNTAIPAVASVSVTLSATTGTWQFPTPGSTSSTFVTLTEAAPCANETWIASTEPGVMRFTASMGGGVALAEVEQTLTAGVIETLAIDAQPATWDAAGGDVAVSVAAETTGGGLASDGTEVALVIVATEPVNSAVLDAPAVAFTSGSSDDAVLTVASGTTSVTVRAAEDGPSGVFVCRTLTALGATPPVVACPAP